MTIPDTFTTSELLLALAKVKPAPVSKFCFPCPRCNYERQSSQPSVALGLYTAEGLTKHLSECHGEPA